MSTAAIRIYDANASAMIARFEAQRSKDVLAPVLSDLPPPPSRILDIGAGPGLDARWLAGQGHHVTAAEPVAAFREHGLRQGGVIWVDCSLPALAGLEGPFDLFLGVGVWHHLAPADRAFAFARLAVLSAPKGRLVLSLRQGPLPDIGGVFEVLPGEEVARALPAGWHLDRMQDEGPAHSSNHPKCISFVWAILTKGEPDA